MEPPQGRGVGERPQGWGSFCLPAAVWPAFREGTPSFILTAQRAASPLLRWVGGQLSLARPQSLPDPSRQSTFLIFQGPCHRDLHEVLGRLSEEQQSSGQLYRFYLPNCSKNGFYHRRQVRALPRASLMGTVPSGASLQNPAFLAGEGASPKYAP